MKKLLIGLLVFGSFAAIAENSCSIDSQVKKGHVFAGCSISCPDNDFTVKGKTFIFMAQCTHPRVEDDIKWGVNGTGKFVKKYIDASCKCKKQYLD